MLYANIDNFDPKDHPIENVKLTLMDKWVLSRLNQLVKRVDDDLCNYRIPEPARAITEFVDDLSNWYVRRCRERFWGKGMDDTKEAAFVTLYTVLVTLSKVIAPFVPFMAEEMYQNLVRSVDPTAPESVHLCDFPTADESLIDESLNTQMSALLSVVGLGRACRAAANLKVRQPLSTLYVKGTSFDEAFSALAEDELNVKKVVFTDDARAFTTYNLKPQMRTLGPKYGKLLGRIGQHLKELDGNDVVDAFSRGENRDLHAGRYRSGARQGRRAHRSHAEARLLRPDGGRGHRGAGLQPHPGADCRGLPARDGLQSCRTCARTRALRSATASK